MEQDMNRFLGEEPVEKLMKKYSIPCIISLLVGALYNIVDQIFIANASYLGSYGNAANTVVFPLTVIALAIAVIAVIMMHSLLLRSPVLHLAGRSGDRKYSFSEYCSKELLTVLKIAIPVAIDNIIMGFAYVAFTRIVSPFGTTSIAANSFSITAESLCYMPGFGIGVAATTIVGQCIGARRKELAKSLGWMAVILGMVIMGMSGALMWIFAPQMIGILTPDKEIRALGVQILRIEAFAEPLYGASIVAAGVFRGAGETLLSSVLNLLSVWAVRIPLAAYLGSMMGLKGAWIAMCLELCVRGTLFLVRLLFWNKKRNMS